MGERSGGEAPHGRRHIIERPRLRTLIDECGCRVVLLTAPAGYGKTTLLRQWIVAQPGRHGWLTITPASKDVAELAADFAVAAARVVPGADRSLHERLRVTPTPEHDVRGLAGVLEQDLSTWPGESWMVLDDYHLIDERSAGEDFIQRVVANTPLNLMVASRRRPVWATARDVLYGEAFEVDQGLLAMTETEAAEVLGNTVALRQLVSQARGWPAVLGLAALVNARRVPQASVPDALHEYFADELFEQASSPLRDDLLALAVIPHIDADITARVLGSERAPCAVDEAIALGFLTSGPGSIELHPLLRQFLREKLAAKSDEAVSRVVTRVGDALVALERWAEALAVAEEFRIGSLLETALDHSLDRMLQEGRTTSAANLLDLADELGITSPSLDVAAAEIALRRGIRPRAVAFANAALETSTTSETSFRALLIAGKAAYFDDRYDEAVDYFERARAEARSPEHRRESLWGLFLCLNQLDMDDGLLTLNEFVEHSQGDVDSELRAATALCISIDRTGDAAALLRRTDAAAHLMERSKDPMIRSSFMNARSRALSLTGRYREALEIAAAQRGVAERFRLDFANASLECTAAIALMGLRQFSAARDALDRAGLYAERLGDLHNEVDAAAIRCRLLLATGRPNEALAVTEPRWDRLPSPGMRSELAACRALAYACLCADGAFATALDSESWSSARYPRVTALFASAITAIQSSSSSMAASAVAAALDAVAESGIVDPMVCAYRGYPPLLKRLGESDKHDALVRRIVLLANDVELAGRMGFQFGRSVVRRATLSPREQEVLDLIAHGLTNRQIASTLYISESTAKVHVRHILEKLGAQSRTEAVALTRTRS